MSFLSNLKFSVKFSAKLVNIYSKKIWISSVRLFFNDQFIDYHRNLIFSTIYVSIMAH